jgi:hypothetical protein
MAFEVQRMSLDESRLETLLDGADIGSPLIQISR